jgi:hypothetical protein
MSVPCHTNKICCVGGCNLIVGSIKNFEHTSRTSKFILISYRANYNSEKLHGLILFYFFSLKNCHVLSTGFLIAYVHFKSNII